MSENSKIKEKNSTEEERVFRSKSRTQRSGGTERIPTIEGKKEGNGKLKG